MKKKLLRNKNEFHSEMRGRQGGDPRKGQVKDIEMAAARIVTVITGH